MDPKSVLMNEAFAPWYEAMVSKIIWKSDIGKNTFILAGI
jgi:hypothetical protein